MPDAPGVTHLVLKQRDRAYPFQVVQHFRAFEACDVIETWVELENGEPGAVRLGRMDSFAMDFPLLANSFYVQSATGQWAAEAQLRESALERGQTVTIGSRSGVRDAWENNASVMLTFGDRASETAGRVIGGVLCWSGMWNISVQRDQCDFVEVRAGADTSAGAYVLDAGKSITLPKFAFTFSSTGKGQISRNIHRWARDWQLPAGHKLRPVLLNSWEGSYFSFTEQVLHDMMDGVKEMGGELFVLDDGWFGTGKYARDDVHRDKVGLGDWVINPEKLPHGLVGLSDEAKKRGLQFGFWVEPEMVNTNSWLYEAHPEWVIREKNRPVNVGRGGSETVLDYSNPAVRANIYDQLDALYSKIPDLSPTSTTWAPPTSTRRTRRTCHSTTPWASTTSSRSSARSTRRWTSRPVRRAAATWTTASCATQTSSGVPTTPTRASACSSSGARASSTPPARSPRT